MSTHACTDTCTHTHLPAQDYILPRQHALLHVRAKCTLFSRQCNTCMRCQSARTCTGMCAGGLTLAPSWEPIEVTSSYRGTTMVMAQGQGLLFNQNAARKFHLLLALQVTSRSFMMIGMNCKTTLLASGMLATTSYPGQKTPHVVACSSTRLVLVLLGMGSTQALGMRVVWHSWICPKGRSCCSCPRYHPMNTSRVNSIPGRVVNECTGLAAALYCFVVLLHCIALLH